MNQLLLGAISMACLVVAFFFLRFWKNTRDRFFLFFSTAFGLEGINRALLGLNEGFGENYPLFYLIRFISYMLILVAILDKNRMYPSDASSDNGVEE